MAPSPKFDLEMFSALYRDWHYWCLLFVQQHLQMMHPSTDADTANQLEVVIKQAHSMHLLSLMAG